MAADICIYTKHASILPKDALSFLHTKEITCASLASYFAPRRSLPISFPIYQKNYLQQLGLLLRPVIKLRQNSLSVAYRLGSGHPSTGYRGSRCTYLWESK